MPVPLNMYRKEALVRAILVCTPGMGSTQSGFIVDNFYRELPYVAEALADYIIKLEDVGDDIIEDGPHL